MGTVNQPELRARCTIYPKGTCACVLVCLCLTDTVLTFLPFFPQSFARVLRQSGGALPSPLAYISPPPLFYTLAWRGDTLLSACLITVVPIKLSFASRSRAAPSLTQYCAQQNFLDEVGAGGCGIVDTLDISLPPPPMFCA